MEFSTGKVGQRGEGGQPPGRLGRAAGSQVQRTTQGGVAIDEGIKVTCSRYLAGSDDEAVLVLVLELLGVVQLLPADTHGHHAQLVVRAKVV